MDDPENQRIADEYGICVSTSHHEPMQRATTEWFEEETRADGTWDWIKSREEIIEFFRKGVRRAQGLESYFTLGIRGEYDRGMVTDDPGAVIRDVLLQQRALFKEVYGREDAVPQVLALYKEVQDLYQAGEFTVPDDVTLLFADDNFGSLRRLPSGAELTRSGGAGIYYHFEYVGAPRSYKWINSNSLVSQDTPWTNMADKCREKHITSSVKRIAEMRAKYGCSMSATSSPSRFLLHLPWRWGGTSTRSRKTAFLDSWLISPPNILEQS